MKKLGVILLISLFLVSAFVSAQSVTQVLSEGATSFYENIFKPAGQFLLGKNTETGDLFFGKLLLFIIILSVIWLAVDKFPLMIGKGKTSFIIAAAISILSVRYITADWVDTIILPYTALGITLASFIPFIIYFFFVEKGLENYRTMRKIAWIFAAVIFFGLFTYRNAAVTTTSFFGIVTSTSTPGFNPSYVYLIAAGLSLVMLSLDKTIQSAFARAKVANIEDIHKAERQIKLDNRFIEVTKHEDRETFDKRAANRIIQDIRTRAEGWGIPVARYPLYE